MIKGIKESINNFSFGQMTSNNSGKTSASGTMGSLICITGSISFLIGTILQNHDILLQSVIFTGIGAGLLGYRKSQKEEIKIEEDTTKEEETFLGS